MASAAILLAVKHPTLPSFQRWLSSKRARSRPWELGRWLVALDAEVRAKAERLAFEAWGRPGGGLARFRRLLAWSLALERDLTSLPPARRFAFHVLDPIGGLTEDAMVGERLAKLERLPGWLLEEVGYSARELRAMSPAELREAFEGAGSLLFSPGAGTPKLAEAPSIDRLLTEVCEGFLHHEVSSVEFDLDDTEEHEWLLPFFAIEDQALRQQAVGLHGTLRGMRRHHVVPQVYLRTVLLRRPGWTLVCAWTAVPPRQDDAWCVLMC